MGDELKGCPFCPNGGDVSKDWVDPDGYMVYCDACGDEYPLEFWQSRPREDALQAEIDRLKAENEEMRKAAVPRGLALEVQHTFQLEQQPNHGNQETNKYHGSSQEW